MYYPSDDYLQVKLGSMPFYDGLGWRVGTRENILINGDVWILWAIHYRLHNGVVNANLSTTANLIYNTNRVWKREIILIPLRRMTQIGFCKFHWQEKKTRTW